MSSPGPRTVPLGAAFPMEEGAAAGDQAGGPVSEVGPELVEDDLGALLAGIAPDAIPALVSAQELEAVYPLLNALAGGSQGDFLLKVAALESIVDDGRALLAPPDLERILYFAADQSRERVIRALRRSGWLGYDGQEGGYRLTSLGRWTHDVLAFLRQKVQADSPAALLVPTIEGIDFLLRTGADPVRVVSSLRGRLLELREEMERAYRSHSELILREAIGRLQEALSLSERIRHVLARIPKQNRQARELARDIHDLLSRLHGAGSELHAATTEVGRQYLRLTAGLTVHDIVRTLRSLDARELSEAVAGALRPVHRPPLLLVTEALAADAEGYLARERLPAEQPRWEEPAAAPEAREEAGLPLEVLAFLGDLDAAAARAAATPLAELVPCGDAGESFLRASLLPLLDGAGAAEGVPGRVAAAGLALVTRGEGPPAPVPEGSKLSALTEGEVVPTRVEGRPPTQPKEAAHG